MALFHRGSPVLYCGKSAVFVREDEEGVTLACPKHHRIAVVLPSSFARLRGRLPWLPTLPPSS
jgi:hypothetical protein